MTQTSEPTVPLPPTESWLPGPKPPDEGWTRRKFVIILFLVIVFHVVLVFLLGTRKTPTPRPVTNVPHLQLVNGAKGLIALDNPTLFARPNTRDTYTPFWRQLAPFSQPNFDWTEPPRYLPLKPANLGSVFDQFVAASQPVAVALDFKTPPVMVLPPVPLDETGPQVTTVEISGDLAGRRLLTPLDAPSVPVNDVIAPSTVQALVDTSGNVASAVILEPNPYDPADQLALQLVRNLRFAPAPRLMFGEITFTWHTIPTNAAPEIIP